MLGKHSLYFCDMDMAIDQSRNHEFPRSVYFFKFSANTRFFFANVNDFILFDDQMTYIRAVVSILRRYNGDVR